VTGGCNRLAGCGKTMVVYLVHLVALVCLVQPNKQDKPNKPNNGLLTLADLFSILLYAPVESG
jgi:hypothetical protein